MAKDDDKEEVGDEKKKGGKLKLIIIAVPVILIIAGAAWFFLLKPKDDAGGPVTLPEPAPGVVVPLDPITINLAGAHFLKLGMALQPTATAHEAPDGSEALDLAIDQFSGMTLDELSDEKGRDHAKEDLIARIKLAYLPHGTDLATAFNGTAEPEASASPAAKAEEKSAKVNTKGLTEEDLAALTDEQAVELASKLSVQPDVYDVYFTEFVMQ